MLRRMTLLALGLCSLGCNATSFQGQAQFPGGPRACYDRCRSSGMQMTSYVYVGEYSTGCICGLAPTGGGEARADASTAASSAAAVGVVLQMREQERAQANAAQQNQLMMMH